MIVVDTSAIVAIALGEPERDAFVGTIEQAGKALISAASVVEARLVVHGRRGQRGVVLLDDLLRLPFFEWVAPGPAEPKHEVAPLQPAARGRKRRGRWYFEKPVKSR